jgi:3-dehydroquinate synthetase
MTCKLGNRGPGLGQVLNISHTTANALEDQTGYMYTQHSEHIANIRSEIIYPIGQ